MPRPKDVTVFALDGEELDFENSEFDYISFVNQETFGKPALIAPGPDQIDGPARVLYVNTGGVAAVVVDKP